MELFINENVKMAIPNFKLGLITYHDITVTETPQLITGRFQLLLEEWLLKINQQAVSDILGVKEWRGLFKAIGGDPSRYRPSHEALIRRLIKDRSLPSIHTAADVNNCFSVYYEIPMGIYDLDHLEGPITLRVGDTGDTYQGINGRDMSMDKKFLTADALGSFGSPIVDSKRSMVTEQTKNAIQILYLRPSTTREAAQEILENVSKTFMQCNGGEIETSIIE
jgi:DNA/RNA-binding domain of Phe-tRNA-synthetase-like protein